ncbi:hypothetical protein ACNUDN_20860 [Mycobacterium sp. smrl_JER01]|uniref:hypothetical protein n=1 Tax=Mycobacterium sp. smrl_JER01 TaxID=3402633 RepID=UPI003AC36343
MSAYPDPTITSTSQALVTTAASAPALRTGAVVLGLASLVDLSKARRGWAADRMLAVSGAAAAGWFLVEGRRRR